MKAGREIWRRPCGPPEIVVTAQGVFGEALYTLLMASQMHEYAMVIRRETVMTPPSAATEPLPQVRLKIERRSSHPWIFQKMVDKPPNRLPDGSVVDILDRAGQWVGRGFYNGHSRIALRVLTADREEAIDEAFFNRRLTRAV